jgi:hypothetical protein
MRRVLIATAAALAVAVTAAPANAQILGAPLDCRVILPGHGIDTHQATDYVEVTIVNTAYVFQPTPHPEGIMYVRDGGLKVLYRPKDHRAWNYEPQGASSGVPVDFCEWDSRRPRVVDVWRVG